MPGSSICGDDSLAAVNDNDFEVKPLFSVIFSSRDFYSQASYGGHIKGPVEHLVTMLKQLGADAVPGAPLQPGDDRNGPTRISGYVGWQQAARKLIPTPRRAPQFDLTAMLLDSGAKNTAEAVDYLLWRLLRVPAATSTRDALVTFLNKELGTDTLERAKTYMEDALRLTVHLIMSMPEYQVA